MRSLVLSLLGISLLTAANFPQEEQLKAALSTELTRFASWCNSKGLVPEAKSLLEEALAVFPEHPAALALQKRLKEEGEVSDTLRKEYDRKWAAAAKKVSKYYIRLSSVKHDAKQAATYDGYLLRAVELDPKAVKVVQTQWKKSYAKKDWQRVHRLLSGIGDEKNAGVLKEVEAKLSVARPVLKTASTHMLEYWLSLPKGWTPEKTWPILVTVDGAGCNFRGIATSYAGKRGDLPFIIVSPCTFANTNALNKNKYNYPDEVVEKYDKGGRMGFDEPGLLAALKDVQKEYNGEKKIFITGFSGGGNLTWSMVFQHADMLRGASPACANFAGAGNIPAEMEGRADLPVKAFQGSKDQYIDMLNRQWESAKSLCDKYGYKNVSREMLEGVGHSSCVGKVLEFFSEILKKE